MEGNLSKIENKEKPLNIEVNFLFTPHASAEDSRNFEAEFEKTDVYIPELHPALEEFFNEVSNGKKSPESLRNTLVPLTNDAQTFYLSILKYVYNSHKPIIMVDTEDIKRMQSAFKEMEENYIDMINSFNTGRLDEAIGFQEAVLHSLLQGYFAEREDKIIEQFQLRLKTLQQEFPQLQNKQNIKILMTYGSAHTDLARRVREEIGLPTSSKFNYMPYVYSHFFESLRHYQHDKKPDKLLLAKSIVEILYDSAVLRPLSRNSDLIIRVARKAVSGLSLQDIAKISELQSQGRSFEKALKELDFPVPKSPEEFEELVKKYELQPAKN